MAKKNKIEDLRDHLFETLEALSDPDKPMDLARARTIADVARVVVDSAKVEVEMARVTDALKITNFFPEPVLDAPPSRPELPSRQTPRA